MSNLALDLRPQSLDAIIGQDAAKRAIKSFAEKDNWPNVFLFYGPPGTGTTTFAEIVAKLIAGEDGTIHQINGSVQNKVEDARELSEIASSCPFNGRPRVFIVNEFHRWTAAAQDAVKDTMEKAPAVWILTTDSPGDISAAILSRAKAATFALRTLTGPEICILLDRTCGDKISVEKGKKIVEFLWEHKATSPREILGVLDQYLAGVPLEQCVHGSEHEPLYSSVAKTIVTGDWEKTRELLKNIKTAECRGMVAVVSAFLRHELLNVSIGPKGDGISSCLVGLDQTGFADGVAFGAITGLFYKVCKILGSK